MSDSVKVFFVQKLDNGAFETESLWCTKDGDNYIIDNIPFVVMNVSLGDTIKAEYDEEDKVLYFEDLVKVSGNTTVRLYFNDENNIESVRRDLKDFQCEGEVFLARRILAIYVPSFIDYSPVKKYLEDGELQQKWQYEESCLAHEY